MRQKKRKKGMKNVTMRQTQRTFKKNTKVELVRKHLEIIQKRI